MGRYWTSSRTGRTYDTHVTDAYGNWEEVGDAASGLGPLLGVLAAALGAVVAMGVATLAIVVGVASVAIMVPIALMQWPLGAPLLLLTALVLMATPAGRLRRRTLRVAAVVSALMIPMVFVSAWQLNGGNGDGAYAWFVSLPWVPLASLAAAAWCAIKGAKALAWVALAVGLVSGLFAAMPWIGWLSSRPFDGSWPAADGGFDNLLGLAGLVVGTLLAGVIAQQVAMSKRGRAGR